MKTHKIIKNFILNFIHNKNNILYKTINYILLFLILFCLFIFIPDISYKKKEIKKQIDMSVEKYDNNNTPIFIFDNNIWKEQILLLKEFLEIIRQNKNINSGSELLIKKNLKFTKDFNLSIRSIILKENNFSYTIESMLNKIYNNGIVDQPFVFFEKYKYSGIKIGKFVENQLIYTHTYIYDLTTLENLNKTVLSEINQFLPNLNEDEKNNLSDVIYPFLLPNTFLNKELTELKKNNVTDNINANNRKKTKQIFLLNNKEVIFSSRNLIINFLFVFFMISILYLFINYYEKKNFLDFKNYIFISFILTSNLIFLLIPIYLGYEKNNIYLMYYIPISSISISSFYLYSKSFSAFFTFFISIFFFYITDFNSNIFIFIIFSGIFTTFLIHSIVKITDLLLSSFIISVINILISVFIFFYNNSIDIQYSLMVLFSITNGMASLLISIAIIFSGERFLNTTTVFRLHELSQLSSSLLKELFNNAIGTYNHSIIVGNLAEAASIEIGANSLLAKVGGYYHDVGKLENPEYFIENQKYHNKHDMLKPTISTAIIKAHVRIGVEKAKKEHLPKKIIDIIAQHHGNSVIKYFYEEALKKNEPDKEEVQMIEFQYQAQNPDFPESAIVMLADQVEAVTRSMKKYTMPTIEKIVEKIINERFQEGILDDSGLTLKDLTKIKKIFTKLVIGMYHPRIEYPNQEKNDIIDDDDGKTKKI